MDDTPTRTIRLEWDDQRPSDMLCRVGEWLAMHATLEAAFEYYEAAISLDPPSARAAFRYCEQAFNAGLFELAAEKAAVAVALNADHAPTHYLASRVNFEAGNVEAALVYADSTLALNPLHAAAFRMKLTCLDALQRWSEMAFCYDEANAAVLEGYEVKLWRALAAAHLDDVETARKILEAVRAGALRRHPSLAKRLQTFINDADGTGNAS